MRNGLFLCAVFSVACSVAASQGAEPLKEHNTKEILAMVDQLVSPNPKPVTMDEDRRIGGGYKTPEGFDATKQQAVFETRRKLLQLGPVAFPFLMDRWDDERYCLSTQNALSGAWHNYSVGRECRTIIFDQLQPYGYWPERDGGPVRGKPLRPQYPAAFFASQEDAKAWWAKHKDKPLYEMQLMVVEWIIEEEAKKPGDFTGKEDRYLQEIRDTLVKTKKPLQAGNFYSADRESRIRSALPAKD